MPTKKIRKGKCVCHLYGPDDCNSCYHLRQNLDRPVDTEEAASIVAELTQK